MAWHLTRREREKANTTGRLLVQAPGSAAAPFASGSAALLTRRRIEDIPVADLILLAAMDDLAEQGNRVAVRAAEIMRERMGIDRRSTFQIGRPGHAED